MNSEQQFYLRRHIVFDPMNAHSQADDPSLLYVMRFNAEERESQEMHIQRLPKAQQRFVMQMIETVLAQQDR